MQTVQALDTAQVVNYFPDNNLPLKKYGKILKIFPAEILHLLMTNLCLKSLGEFRAVSKACFDTSLDMWNINWKNKCVIKYSLLKRMPDNNEINWQQNFNSLMLLQKKVNEYDSISIGELYRHCVLFEKSEKCRILTNAFVGKGLQLLVLSDYPQLIMDLPNENLISPFCSLGDPHAFEEWQVKCLDVVEKNNERLNFLNLAALQNISEAFMALNECCSELKF